MTSISDQSRRRDLYDLRSDKHAARGSGYTQDFHGAVRELRASGPVHNGSVGELLDHPVDSAQGGEDRAVYSAFSWETVNTALREPQVFSNSLYQLRMSELLGPTVLGMSGAEHRRSRGLVQRAFSRDRVQWWIDRWIGDIVDGLIEDIESEGKADLNLAFCSMLPLQTIIQAFGIPESEGVLWRELIEAMLLPPSAGTGQFEAAGEIARRLYVLIESRFDEPQDDLLSVFTQVEERQEDGTTARLTAEEIMVFARLLLAAGSGTTWRMLGVTLLALLSDPAQLAAVRDNRDLVRNLIEEAIRWEPIDPTFRRLVAEDTTLGGREIPAGAILEMSLAGANRDPDRWSDPDSFDVSRPLKSNAGFGGGPHICIGMHVARAEMSVAINRLLDRCPRLKLDPEAEPPKIIGVENRGVTALPVRWDR